MISLRSNTNTLLLPNPDLADEEAVKQELDTARAMDGDRYTYVKTSSERRLVYQFTNIGRGKVVEVGQFMRANYAKQMIMTNFRSETWNVYITNAIDLSTSGLATPGDGNRGEQGSFALEMVGTKL